MVANDGLLQRVVLTTEISEAQRRMGKAGLLRHLQNLQRKRPRQSVALQKSRRTGFHALEGRALSRPQRVLQVPLLINFNKPTLIVNRRSETFFSLNLCVSACRAVAYPRRRVPSVVKSTKLYEEPDYMVYDCIPCIRRKLCPRNQGARTWPLPSCRDLMDFVNCSCFGRRCVSPQSEP